MKALKAKLNQMEDVQLRKKSFIIRDLVNEIEEAQDQGYRLSDIHKEINTVINIEFPSFKTFFYKAKKENENDDNS